jgi:hypothetical protein
MAADPTSTLTIARRTATCIAAIAALTAVPVAAAAKLEGGAQYAGATSDGGAVQLRLSGNGRLVARMRIHYTVRCDNDRTGTTYTTIINVRIRHATAFSGRGSYTGAADKSLNKFKVSGALTKRHASGTFSLVATGPAGTGDTVTCKTGRLRWHASRTT